MITSLTIAGVDICDRYHIVTTEISTYEKPQKNVSRISVPGRNGDIIIDSESSENVSIGFTCVINQNFRQNYDALTDFLYSLDGYVRIEDDEDGDHYRLGYFTGGISVKEIVQDAGRFDITFSCKPQRFLKSGDIPIEFQSETPAEPYQAETYEMNVYSYDYVVNHLDPASYDKFNLIQRVFEQKGFYYDGVNYLEVRVPVPDSRNLTVSCYNENNAICVCYAEATQSMQGYNIRYERLVTEDNVSTFYLDRGFNMFNYADGYLWLYIALIGGDFIKVDGQTIYQDVDCVLKTINNPTLSEAEPLIELDISSVNYVANVRLLTINDVDIYAWQMPQLTATTLYINSDIKQIYYSDSGELKTASKYVKFLERFPTLKKGENTIIYPKDASVKITPKWWTI